MSTLETLRPSVDLGCKNPITNKARGLALRSYMSGRRLGYADIQEIAHARMWDTEVLWIKYLAALRELRR